MGGDKAGLGGLENRHVTGNGAGEHLASKAASNTRAPVYTKRSSGGLPYLLMAFSILFTERTSDCSGYTLFSQLRLEVPKHRIFHPNSLSRFRHLGNHPSKHAWLS